MYKIATYKNPTLFITYALKLFLQAITKTTVLCVSKTISDI